MGASVTGYSFAFLKRPQWRELNVNMKGHASLHSAALYNSDAGLYTKCGQLIC